LVSWLGKEIEVVREWTRFWGLTAALMVVVGLTACTSSPSGVGTGDDPGSGEVADGGDAADDVADPGDTDPEDDDAVELAVFTDPDTGFSTTDVHDVDEEIVQFDTGAKTIIWAADSSAYEPDLWTVSGNFLTADQFFQVRFGTKDGERRAYFTETGRATICNLSIQSGRLDIAGTNVTVPQS
jgi:hypothetical protein